MSEIREGQTEMSGILEGQAESSEILEGRAESSEILGGEAKTSRILERSKENVEHEDWDPRVMDATSVQNLIYADGNNEAAFIMGTKGFKQPRSLREIPCKFPVLSTGFCWKGPRCPYLHDPAALTSDYVDVGKQVVVSLANLEKPTELITEAILNCTVTGFVNFSEFYVVPNSSHTCLCEHIVGPASYRRKDPNCTNESVNRDHQCNRSKGATMMAGENPNVKTDVPLTSYDYWEGTEALRRMEGQLNAELSKNSAWRSLQSSVYAQTEMVAVHGESGLWERGVVLNENASNSVGRDIPLCKVRLIDRGPVVTVSASSMCSLPQKYCNCPPLAIKCCLAGIVPIRYTWLKRICKAWSDILCEKKVLIIVRQQPSPETKIVPVLHEKDEDDLSWPIAPYLVDVILTPELSQLGSNNINKEYKTNQYLSDILVEQGWAIKESKFPYRPELEYRYRSRTLDELLLPRKSSEIHKPYSQEEELIELERFKSIVDIESHVGPPPNVVDLPQHYGPPPSMSGVESYGDPPSVASENGNYDHLTSKMELLGEEGDLHHLISEEYVCDIQTQSDQDGNHSQANVDDICSQGNLDDIRTLLNQNDNGAQSIQCGNQTRTIQCDDQTRTIHDDDQTRTIRGEGTSTPILEPLTDATKTLHDSDTNEYTYTATNTEDQTQLSYGSTRLTLISSVQLGSTPREDHSENASPRDGNIDNHPQ